MQTIVHISASPSRLPENVFHALLNTYPEGAVKTRSWTSGEIYVGSWSCKLSLNDSRAIDIIAFLKSEGYFVDNHAGWVIKKPGIRIWLSRKYGMNDYGACEFLALNGRHRVLGLGWRTTPDSTIVLPVHRIRKLVTTGAETLWTDRPGWMVVSDRVKRIVDGLNMRHVVFRPTILVRGEGRPDDPTVPWSEVGDPWWEISSDYALPPLSSSVQITAQDGTPFESYETQNLELREGLYDIPEPHYRRSDINSAEPFDLALSHEHIGKPPLQQMRIASQRLYLVFRKHKIRAAWTPVRIDDH